MRKELAIIAFVLGSLLLLSSPSWAQVGSQGFQYVVKFICGDADALDSRGKDLNGDGVMDTGQFIARGEYHTVINVHNPNVRFVNMFKKLALDGYRIVDGRPRFLFQVPGPVFFINIVDGTIPPLDPRFDPDGDGLPRFFSLEKVAIKLSPDETFQINCPEIRAVVNDWTLRAQPKRPGNAAAVNTEGEFGDAFLIKGYLIIFSESKLDVTAIYTACGEGTSDSALDCGTGFGVRSVDIEEIKENPVAPPANLVPPKAASLSVSAAGRELRVDLGSQRFSALSETRLIVYDLRGHVVHDSGFVSGTALSWRPMSTGKPLANGVYLYAVMAKDVFGRVGYKIGKFALMR